MHAVKQIKHCLMNESNLKSANRIKTANSRSHSVLTIISLNILTIFAQEIVMFTSLASLN